MSAIAPGRLLSVEGVGDPVAVLQTDLEALTEDVYEFTPTYQSGVETTLIGPPTSGTFTEDTLWKDAWLATWRCTVAGTPGTWRQETPAIRAGEPSSGTIPTSYQILDSSVNYRRKYHAGSFVWTPVNEAYGAAATVYNSVFDSLGAMGAAGGIYWRSGDDITATAALTGILRGNGASGPEVIGSLTANRLARIGTSGQTLVNSIVRDDGTNVCVGADVVAGQLVFQVTGGISLIGASTLKTSAGALTLDTTDSSVINFKIGGSNGWIITSASVLEAVGAATIRTSTGNLTISTAAGNGNVLVNPHGTGDFIVNTDDLYVDTSTGNVGFGTTSPAEKFDLQSGIALFSSNTTAGLTYIKGDSLDFRYDANSQQPGYINNYGYAGGLTQFRDLAIRNGKGGDVMYIQGSTGNVGIGTTVPDRLCHAEVSDAVTAAVTYGQRLSHITSGTAAAGFGVGIEFELENSTGTNIVTGSIINLLSTVGASWISDTIVYGGDSGSPLREGLRVRGSGSAAQIGFLGATPISRQANIVDADGTLADITTKFNTLLGYLESFGLLTA